MLGHDSRCNGSTVASRDRNRLSMRKRVPNKHWHSLSFQVCYFFFSPLVCIGLFGMMEREHRDFIWEQSILISCIWTLCILVMLLSVDMSNWQLPLWHLSLQPCLRDVEKSQISKQLHCRVREMAEVIRQVQAQLHEGERLEALVQISFPVTEIWPFWTVPMKDFCAAQLFYCTNFPCQPPLPHTQFTFGNRHPQNGM